jgi:hypothetical protein
MFHEILELMFRQLPGHDRVRKEQYSLAVQDTGALVKSSEWSSAVSPGSIILMSILVRVSVFAENDDLPAITCPRCHEKIKSRLNGKAFSRWLVTNPNRDAIY